MKIYNPQGTLILDIEVDDASTRYKALKGDNILTLKYSLAEHTPVPLGSYCEFKGEVYTLMSSEDLTLHHRRSFEYVLTMYSHDARAKRYKFRNPVDGRLKFSLTARPAEHLQMFVDNMNLRDGAGVWSIGECPDHVEILLSYNHTFCLDALIQLAEEMELDYWFEGTKVSLGKLELNKDNPLPLSYGGDGEGLKPDIKRRNYSDALPIEILYVQGSEKNIDFSKYGSKELHLPKSQVIGYDGVKFSDEEGFNDASARWYKTDEAGMYVTRSDKDKSTYAEDSLDCSEIEPTREETVDAVILVDAEKHYYDIVFASDVNYKDYQIVGEKPTVIFQSGMLAGKEFELATDKDGDIICYEEEGKWRVELKPQDIDGITMPDSATNYMPTQGNTFKVFGIQLPAEYIVNNDTKSGAEWEMFRYAVTHLFANEDVQYTISGVLDEIYAKRNWSSIKDRIALGSYIAFSDRSFQEQPILIRIIGIKEYVNKPYSPIIEISNQNIAGSITGTLNRLENKEVYNEDLHRQSIGYTKRRWRDAQETLDMLEKAMLDGFTETVSPIAVKTMGLLVGNESSQFRFVDSMTDPKEEKSPILYYDKLTGKIEADATILQHMTLGINSVAVTHAVNEYKFWNVEQFESEVTDKDTSYYIYVKANKSSKTAEFILSSEAFALDPDDGYYYFLAAILNKEFSGERSLVPLYKFTEVLPGQITTDLIKSADGSCIFDLANNEIRGPMTFLPGTTGIENIEGLSERIEGSVANLEFGKYNLLRNSGFTGDFVTESLDNGSVLDEDSQMFSDPLRHWSASNVAVQDSAVGQSGKEIVLTSGILSQELHDKIISGENYVLSFRGKGVSFDYSVGGVSGTVALESEWTKVVHKFTSVSDASTFAITNANATICDLQLERGTVQSAWGHSMWDNQSELAKYQSMQYLEAAIKNGSTDILGGLILTNLILLGNPESADNNAGISGIRNDDNDVAFWGGGTFSQAVSTVMKYVEDPTYKPTTEELASMAKAVITHGGRAILNDVIVRGTVYAEDGQFSGRIDAKSGKIGDFNITQGISSTKEETSDDGGSVRTVDILPSRVSITATHAASSSFPATEGQVTLMPGPTAGYIPQTFSGIIRTEITDLTGDDEDFSTAITNLILSATGAREINSSGYGGNHAIWIEDGMVAGLRPRMWRITESNTYQLSDVDHTIVTEADDVGIRLTLPSEPKLGQTYKIWKQGSHTLYINPNGKQIVNMGILSNSEERIFSSTFFGTIELIYRTNAGWLMVYVNNSTLNG